MVHQLLPPAREVYPFEHLTLNNFSSCFAPLCGNARKLATNARLDGLSHHCAVVVEGGFKSESSSILNEKLSNAAFPALRFAWGQNRSHFRIIVCIKLSGLYEDTLDSCLINLVKQALPDQGPVDFTKVLVRDAIAIADLSNFYRCKHASSSQLVSNYLIIEIILA